MRLAGLGMHQLGQLLPGAEDADVGGVYDADGKPGNSGGVVGEVPGYMGTVPGRGWFWALIAVCGQAGAGNGADGSASQGHGQQPAAGQHVDPRPQAGVLQLEPGAHGVWSPGWPLR